MIWNNITGCRLFKGGDKHSSSVKTEKDFN